ncbi:MAG: hypothetical protein WC323_01400 [Patescibacteria group bacterium]|jgi:hypothetical protein
MTGDAMQRFFQITFFIGAILAIVIIIGLFLLALKIILLFAPELHIMGMTIV